ncbi:MAG: class I SAM-dependent methyltransferase [Sulfurovum sp.]|nr:class I SAM-dependent methyltransferase [Sulfurovum sp.]
MGLASEDKSWADIGCSTGLLTRLAHKLHYHVKGFDINTISLLVAKMLSLALPNIHYQKKDFYTIESKFDIVTATSLLSVVEDKKEALLKLISLLKDSNSTLIIIEPTQALSVVNTWKCIHNLSTWWLYKGLLVWAKAREGKAIDEKIFEEIDGIFFSHSYHLDTMVRVTYIKTAQI